MIFSLLFLSLLLVFAVEERHLNSKSVGQWFKQEGKEEGPSRPSAVGLWLALHHSGEAKQKLHHVALAVSTPGSPMYGQHLSVDQITEIVAVDADRLARVQRFLRDIGGTDISVNKNKDLISVTLPTVVAEDVFHVKLAWWRKVDDEGEKKKKKMLFRSPVHPTIPDPIRQDVQIVHGLSELPPKNKHRVMKRKLNTSTDTDAVAAVAARHHVVGRDDEDVVVGPGSTGPVITAAGARGGGTVVVVQVSPTCLNGSRASSLPPCGQDRLQFLVKCAGRPTLVANSTCSLTAGDDVECVFFINYGQMYTPLVNLTVQTVFQVPGGRFPRYQYSDPYVNPFPIVAAPVVLPSTLRAHYQIPPNQQVTGATQAVVEFEGQFYSESDLRQFFRETGQNEQNTDNVLLIGPNKVSDPGVEASLDIQYIMALAPMAKTTFWSVPQKFGPGVDDILKWAYDVMNTTTAVPSVFSISYGFAEELVDTYLGPGYVDRSLVEFAKLAARGLSVIVSTGDTGAGLLGNPPENPATCNKQLSPDWPATSAYVTAVGSTLLTPYADPVCNLPQGGTGGGVPCQNQPVGEVTTSLEQGVTWTAGGGFSRGKSAQPAFQRASVSAWSVQAKQNGLYPPQHLFNVSGRAVPDLVTCGHNLMVIYNKTQSLVDGTSASTPIFAAMITLINAERQQAGKRPLGWLNPALYQLPVDSWYDVVTGSNRCGAYPRVANPKHEICCPHAFHAQPGWDPVTGLGSPIWSTLSKYLTKN